VTEWPIREVARATGLTSRTLRHYEQIGLLTPSRVAGTGYRYYGERELARLYRILSLRALELPLAAIRRAIDDDADLSDALREHVRILNEKQQQTAAQIVAVEHTLSTIENGTTMVIDDLFKGVNNAEHEEEVRSRWGDEAWERSQQRRANMTPAEHEADERRSADVNAALRAAAESNEEPGGARFQELVTDHYAWITDQWGGRRPTKQAYLGLAQLYVDDERFATVYGGPGNAETIRAGIEHWANAHLA
jgi:DNA-binding transcriptional MerR regulator